MAFEHKSAPLLSIKDFVIRMVRFGVIALVLITLSLGIGILGYHFFDELSWIDSVLNASMILAGMGPVDPLKNDVAKWFASFYAIFSGVVFLSTVAVFLSPIAHRFLHRLHLNEDEK
jgi:hypothetical protein